MSQCEADKLDSLEDGTAKWLMADWSVHDLTAYSYSAYTYSYNNNTRNSNNKQIQFTKCHFAEHQRCWEESY